MNQALPWTWQKPSSGSVPLDIRKSSLLFATKVRNQHIFFSAVQEDAPMPVESDLHDGSLLVVRELDRSGQSGEGNTRLHN